MPKDIAATGATVTADVVAPLSEITETTDAAGDSSTIYTVADGDTVTGTRDAAGDDDWYAITLQEGDYLAVSMDGVTQSDPYLRLYDDDGNQVAYDDDGNGGLDSLMTYNVVVSGTYYIDADAYSNNDTGDYVLTIDATAALPIAVGTAVLGTIADQNLVDYYSVTLNSDTVYFVTLEGAGNTDPIDYPELTVEDAGGYVTENAYLGNDGSITVTFQPDADGLHFILVETLPYYNPRPDGDYRLIIEADIAANPETEATLAPGDRVEGRIDLGGDADWYAVDVAAGDAFAIRMSTDGLSDPADAPDLALYDAAGQPVGLLPVQISDTEVMLIVASLPSGTYYASAQSSQTRDIGEYVLTMEATDPGAITGDAYTGTDGDDIILTGDGADTVAALDGDDYVDTGQGADQVQGGGRADVIRTGGGYDTAQGGGGGDTIDGGDDTDSLSGDSGNDNILGGQGNDRIDGGDDQDVLEGEGGNDTIDGGTGDDTASGGAGHDELTGGDGRDEMSGGSGHDLLLGEGGKDKLDGNGGNDTLEGAANDDTLDGGDGADSISGGSGDDEINGGKGSDSIQGNVGNDTIMADGGHDQVEGGDGDDMLFGRGGNDTLIGGDGDDTFDGGGDADVFVVGDGADIIQQFEVGIDEIVFEDDFFAAGSLSADAPLAGAYVRNGNVVIDGADGNSLVLVGIATLDGLEDSLVF